MVAAVRAAHLQKALEPHLGEECGQVVGPIGERGLLARKLREPAGQKVPEGGARRVDVAVFPAHEVHRHVERIVHIALVAHAVLESEGQHPRPRYICVEPDGASHAQVAVRLSFGERRIGEQRRRNRLQGQRHAHLLHHVGFAGEIEVHLHGAGAVHHVEAQAADLGHVSVHDAIAALGHPGNFGERPKRRKAKAQKRDAKRPRHFAHQMEMLGDFLAGLQNRLQRRARKLELPAGLQRDRAAERASGVRKRDDILQIVVRTPAGYFRHAFEQRPNTGRPLVGHGPQAIAIERKFFVLGAYAPIRLGFFALLDIGGKLVAAFDHGVFRGAGRCHCVSVLLILYKFCSASHLGWQSAPISEHRVDQGEDRNGCRIRTHNPRTEGHGTDKFF